MSLSAYLSLYQQPPGRVTFAARQVAEIATKWPAILRSAEEAIAAGEHAVALKREWKGVEVQHAQYGPRAVEMDLQVDHVLAGLYNAPKTFANSFPAAHTMAQAARNLLRTAFPAGLAAITQLPFVDELAAAKDLLKLLKGPLTDEVAVLGLSPLVDHLETLLPDYEDALQPREGANLTWAEVNQSQLDASEALFRLVVVILGTFPGPAAEDIAQRELLMAPILTQEEALKRHYKRSYSPVDLNPDKVSPQPEGPNTP